MEFSFFGKKTVDDYNLLSKTIKKLVFFERFFSNHEIGKNAIQIDVEVKFYFFQNLNLQLLIFLQNTK
jgi:hypothetical protein